MKTRNKKPKLLWIARDRSGELWAYQHRPRSHEELGIWYSNSGTSEILPAHIFEHITWKKRNMTMAFAVGKAR